jgi:pyridinium-3,5-biscarboxylic acid mononucleotide synthase
MDSDNIKKLLEDFKNGEVSSDQFILKLKFSPYENLNFARLDYHRKLRIGIPEVIFCEGKTTDQIINIVTRMTSDNEPVLATRVSESVAEKLRIEFPSGKYNTLARTFSIIENQKNNDSDTIDVCLVTAGTSDIPVAEEARETLDFLGVKSEPVYDVGVAGLHRFLGEENKLEGARVLIVIAGMEGALASVVGGLFSKPIIAVPTSIGYGTSFSGLSPLLSMLNACSSGITVVNIDNGYGAACAAYRIIRTMREAKE